jgi:hypothetical protein
MQQNALLIKLNVFVSHHSRAQATHAFSLRPPRCAGAQIHSNGQPPRDTALLSNPHCFVTYHFHSMVSLFNVLLMSGCDGVSHAPEMHLDYLVVPFTRRFRRLHLLTLVAYLFVLFPSVVPCYSIAVKLVIVTFGIWIVLDR